MTTTRKTARPNPGAGELQAPLVHLNGTSGADLLETLSEAASAVFRARDALVRSGPNQRDFYPLEEGAWERAIAEHDARSRRLAEVEAELEAIVDAVQEQILERERSREARRAPLVEVRAPADLPPGDHVVEVGTVSPKRVTLRVKDVPVDDEGGKR